MQIDLRNKQWLTLGKKDTGKSFFNNNLMANARGNYAVFDPMDEHTDYKDSDVIVVPSVKRGPQAVEQLEDFIDFVTHNRHTFDYVIIDEVNRFHQKGGTLDGAIGELVDLSAHYDEGMGVGFIARKPTQVHVDLRDLSDYLIIFRLTGVGDARVLDEISSGLGERVSQLKPKEFIVVSPDGSYQQYPPIQGNLDHRKGI